MFPKSSPFSEDHYPGYPGPPPRDPPLRNASEGSTQVSYNDIESWYDTLNELCQALDIPREHVVSSRSITPLYEQVEQLRDQVYRYLRG